jgi:hypothetical protein
VLTTELLQQVNLLSSEDLSLLQSCIQVKIGDRYRIRRFHEARETISVMLHLRDFLGTSIGHAEQIMEGEYVDLLVETKRQRELIQQMILQGCAVQVIANDSALADAPS